MPLSIAPAMGVSLRELLPNAHIVGATDIRVTSCASDSRACQPGDLFVALPGRQADGHDFAVHAMARGARAVLTDRVIPNVAIPLCLVPSVRAAYGSVCHALLQDPSSRLKVIGHAGASGKTATSYLAASVLEAAGMSCGVIGALGYFDGCDVERAALAAPDAAELAQLLARMEANHCSHVALETSNQALAEERLAGLTLDIATIMSVREVRCREGRTDCENELRILRLLRPEGMAIFNVDDPGAAAVASDYAQPALTIGIGQPAEISAASLEQRINEQTFLLTLGDTTAPVRTPLVGTQNIRNCLAAAAVGEIYGANFTQIIRGIESVSQIPGRLERIECGQPFAVFVDHARTPDALGAALATLRPLVSGRLICVFGADSRVDPLQRARMGRVADGASDLAIITSDNPRDDDPREIARHIQGGAAGHARLHVQLDRARAIEYALQQANTGDCLLIAGKGHDCWHEIEGERVYLDDREIVRTWLFANVGPVPFRQAA